MAVQITIIGLGQIGASAGLALADHSGLIRRIGHDRDDSVARYCIEQDVIDDFVNNPADAVKDSDLVLFCLPIDQIKGGFSLVAGTLKDGAVVLDTSPVKHAAASWAAQELPEGISHVGLIPVLNPAYLHEPDSGVSAARPDLFEGSAMVIVDHPGTSSTAVKKAADLTRLIGARPIFIPSHKLDRILAATEIMPQLLAAALLNATTSQPEWHEGRQIAGRAYEQLTNPITQPADVLSISEAALLHRDNILRVIDGTMATLQAVRNDIEAGDSDALNERLERARHSRQTWWKQRQDGKE